MSTGWDTAIVATGTESIPENLAPLAPGEGPEHRSKTPVVTSRWLWIVTYVATAALLVLRSVELPAYVRSELQGYEGSGELTDERLENLAVNTGIFLGVILSMFILALYYSLASALERNIFRPALVVAKNVRIGLFFMVAALCTLPVQAASAVLDSSSPRDNLLYQAYILVVACTSILLFRRHWQRRSKGKITLLFLCTLTLAILSSAT